MINDFLKKSFISLFIRTVTLLSRFGLVFFIGKYLSLEDLGVFGIFFSTIIFSTFILGYDFYSYRTREILSPQCVNKINIIRDQFSFYIITYFLVLPFLYILFCYKILPFRFIHFFYCLLILEHLSQEFFRIFIVLSKPITANIILFIRSGSWVILMVILFHMGLIKISLNLIFSLWLIASISSLLLSIIILKCLDIGNITEPINWKWIKNGIKVSTPFFISTISYKIIEFSNRYFIDQYLCSKDVGIFTFFINISNVVQTLVFTGIIMLIYPSLVETFDKNKDSYKVHYKNLKKYTISFSLIISLCVLLFIPIILKLMGKVELNDNINLLWLLLISANIFNLSLIPHYSMYVKNKDLHLMVITISAAIINISLNYLLIPQLGLMGAGVSLFISYSIILFLKFIFNNNFRIPNIFISV